jgi:large conductance mechanosensitive channel
MRLAPEAHATVAAATGLNVDSCFVFHGFWCPSLAGILKVRSPPPLGITLGDLSKQPGRRNVRSVIDDFKKFLVKGNLVTLAVAFVMGVVFAALMKAFIADLITPIIALIFGKPNFGGLTFTINHSQFLYGDFINAAIIFVTTAAALFFFVVKPYETWDSRRSTDDPSVKSCPECTTKIPAAARRCPQCTAVLVTGTAGAGSGL